MRRAAPLWLAVATCIVSALCLASAVFAQEPEPLTSTGPNEVDIEMGVLYSHFSKNRLVVNGISFYDVIIIGRLKVDEIRREIVIPSLTVTYGLSPRANLVAMVPVRWRTDNTIKYGHQVGDTGGPSLGPPMEQTFSGAGLGDIEFSLNLDSRFIDKPSDSFITTVGVKTPTGLSPYDASENELPLGTGHWGLKLGFTSMKKYDPVVVFAGTSYFWHLARDSGIEACGIIDPGNTFQYSLGLAYALSRQFTLSARVEQSYTGRTTVGGTPEVGSDVSAGTLYLGGTFTSRNGSAFELTVGAGLTEDSPDFTLKLSWPLRF